MSKITTIKGFADLFPPESEVYSLMEETARDVFTRYGYRELRVPVLEHTELFARSIGAETDVVQKEMYTFPDRKGRSLTLRPEATAGMMRACIEHGLQEGVSKYFSHGPMFRYERPQKGRMRQFHQIDCECLGAHEPQADAEVIFMLMHFLGALGLSGLELNLNTLGCKACRPAYRELLTAYLQGLDQELRCEDCRRRVQTNPLRVLDCKNSGCRSLTENAPTMHDNVCPDCRDHFNVVRGLLEQGGQKFVLNHRLVRGLDYYMRTTFEVVSTNIGAQSSVAGGGRYDGLVAQLGGPDVPGIGFACGMERLAMLMNTTQERRQDFFLAVLDEKALDQAMLLACALRRDNKSGDVSFAAKSAKSQLRQAGKSGARHCLILGGDEFAKGSVLVKDMRTGEQKEILQEELIKALDSL